MKLLRAILFGLSAPFRSTKICYSKTCNKSVNILANGPSLRNELKLLEITDKTLVLNDFYLDSIFWIIKPDYYVLVDPLYFEEKYWQDSLYENMYNKIKRIDWNIMFIIPYKYYSYFKNKVQNSFISIKTIYRYPKISSYLPSKINFLLYKLGLNTPLAQNVLIPSIFSMINLGFNRIYLYGTDHSWISSTFVNSNNEVCLVDKHFYSSENENYRVWKKSNLEPYKLHEVLMDLVNAFKTYHELNAYRFFIDKSIVIINKTKTSYIDAFEKSI